MFPLGSRSRMMNDLHARSEIPSGDSPGVIMHISGFDWVSVR